MDKANGLLQLTFNLYNQMIIENPDQNLIFSPFSVFLALAMLQLGAKDDTDKQLQTVLGINSFATPSEFHTWLKSALHTLQQNSTAQLHLAERLCLQKGVPFLAEFQSSLTSMYSADVTSVDFITNKVETCDEINNWTNEKTDGKINKILSPEIFDDDTLFVLITALYMKADWLKQFSTRRTIRHPFHTMNNIIEVEMMEQKGTFKYTNDPTTKSCILQLPYSVQTICMYIILPENLLELEKVISNDHLIRLIRNLDDTLVNIKLPKFYIESDLPLKDSLSQLGLGNLFTQGAANFSGISPANEIFLSSFIHKATIDVTEAGTEATATSAVVARANRSVQRSEVVDFVADRPFLFVIQDNISGIVLFVGRLIQPKTGNSSFKSEL